MSLEGERISSDQQPKTRTELLRKRQIDLRSLAGEIERVALAKRENVNATPSGAGVDWWTLAEGYKEDALEALARYQRYAKKRAKAQAAERPDPYNTHEVRIKKPSTSLAEKICSAKPPPPEDAEAYSTPRRTVKHFTDEIFYWKAQLESRRDVDERGKNKGGQRRRALAIEVNRLASHPHGRPSAPEVARQALKQRCARRQALEAVSRTCETANEDEPIPGTATLLATEEINCPQSASTSLPRASQQQKKLGEARCWNVGHFPLVAKANANADGTADCGGRAADTTWRPSYSDDTTFKQSGRSISSPAVLIRKTPLS